MAKLPTLTTAGWVEDPVTLATSLLDYFLVTEASQSHFFADQLSSLPYLVQQYGAEPTLMENKVNQTLERYFSRYFTVSSIAVSALETTQDEGRYTLEIDVLLAKEGEQYHLGRLVEIGGSKVINYQPKEN